MAFGYVFEGYRFVGVARESKALTSQRTPKGGAIYGVLRLVGALDFSRGD